jgi:transposase
MTKYRFTFTAEEKEEISTLIQKGGKGYRIKHAQILQKLEDVPENADWTYDRIQQAYDACHSTIAGVAKRFVEDGLEAALGRKAQARRPKFITGDIEAMICTIACSKAPEGASRWTMQMIADKLIQLKVVETISDTAVCDVMKKTRLSRGLTKSGVYPRQTPSS